MTHIVHCADTDGGAWLLVKSPQTNCLVAKAFGAAGTLYFALFGRDLPTLMPTDRPQAAAV